MSNYDKLYGLPTIDLPERVNGKRVLSLDELIERYEQTSNKFPPCRNAFISDAESTVRQLVKQGIIPKDILDAITTINAYNGGYFTGEYKEYRAASIRLERFIKERAPVVKKAIDLRLVEVNL